MRSRIASHWGQYSSPATAYHGAVWIAIRFSAQHVPAQGLFLFPNRHRPLPCAGLSNSNIQEIRDEQEEDLEGRKESQSSTNRVYESGQRVGKELRASRLGLFHALERNGKRSAGILGTSNSLELQIRDE